MNTTTRAAVVKARFAVDVNWDEVELERRLRGTLAFLPTGSAKRCEPFGFSFRREPDAFAAIAMGMTFGMAVLLIEFSMRVRYFSYVAVTLSVVFFILSAALLVRVSLNALLDIEVVADRDELLVRKRLARRVVHTRRVHADRIVSVVVLSQDGPPKVMLGGPRHELLGLIYATRPLDPDVFAPWMAEMVALVARRASLPQPREPA